QTHPLESDHVSAVLLADEPQRRLVLEATVDGPGCEKLIATNVRPRLPTGVRQDFAVIVVATVPVAHGEPDQALIRLVHLFLPPGETDARRVRSEERRVGKEGRDWWLACA